MSGWLSRLAHLVLPTRCLLCHQIGADVLCPGCASRLERVGPAHCLKCGRRRLVSWASPDCGECHGRSIGVRRARSALLYNEPARELLAEFKYRRKLGAGEAIFSATKDWVSSGLQSMFNLEDIEVDYLVPVPLHGQRMRERRFNQALFFATRIGSAVCRPVLPAALVRQRPTPTQVGLSANQRMLNVRGAFAVSPRLQARLAGKSILVVDDLMTTGATLAACAAALKRSKCAAVYGLTMFSTFHDIQAEAATFVKV